MFLREASNFATSAMRRGRAVEVATTTTTTTTTQLYSQVKKLNKSSRTQIKCTSCDVVVACGGSLTAESGRFATPRYPNTYPHGAQCTWFIEAPVGRAIRLTFTEFSLEAETDCDYDYVIVSEGTAAASSGQYASTLSSHLTEFLTLEVFSLFQKILWKCTSSCNDVRW